MTRKNLTLVLSLLAACTTPRANDPDVSATDAMQPLLDTAADDGLAPADDIVTPLEDVIAPADDVLTRDVVTRDVLPACAPEDPRDPPAEISVLPDESEAPYVALLSRAQRSIRVMMYLMGRGGILTTLEQKAREGVQVLVILDGGTGGLNTNTPYRDQLLAAGAAVRFSNPAFPYMHAKTLVIDGSEAIVSTGNASLYSLQHERNYAVHLSDPQDVADLVALFQADWAMTPVDLSCTRLLVSPINSRERILALIGSATTTLDLESMQFADTGVRNAVAARAAAGVHVRALLADPGWITANTAGAQFLAASGAEARYLVTPDVHVKALVVDGVRAYAGSENLSYTSLDRNREVGVILTEPAALAAMARTFETDWARATAF